MRNLAQYPITVAEVIQCLRSLSDNILKEERIGDMRPTLLAEAAQLLEKVFTGGIISVNGSVVVPVEPTKAMVAAGIEAAIQERDHLIEEGVFAIYQAMTEAGKSA